MHKCNLQGDWKQKAGGLGAMDLDVFSSGKRCPSENMLCLIVMEVAQT